VKKIGEEERASSRRRDGAAGVNIEEKKNTEGLKREIHKRTRKKNPIALGEAANSRLLRKKKRREKLGDFEGKRRRGGGKGLSKILKRKIGRFMKSEEGRGG